MNNAMSNDLSFDNNEEINSIEYDRDELLDQLKAYLTSFKESDDLFDKISNKFISLEQELQNILKEKQFNEERLREENELLKDKIDKLLEENDYLRQLKQNEANSIIKKYNDDMMKYEGSSKEGIRGGEDEDLFYFYQNNLNEANQRIKQLLDNMKEYQGLELKLVTKDQQITKLCFTIDEMSNENKMIGEKLSLCKKENALLYSNIALLKEEIKKVSQMIDNNKI